MMVLQNDANENHTQIALGEGTYETMLCLFVWRMRYLLRAKDFIATETTAIVNFTELEPCVLRAEKWKGRMRNIVTMYRCE